MTTFDKRACSRGEERTKSMPKIKEISRRQFVNSAISVAAASSLATPQLLAGFVGSTGAPDASPSQTSSALTADSAWKDQGIENLAKSPHAKLRNVPVHAVTIGSGFWGQRRETNVANSIPSMHDLLEANGRMTNFRRLLDKSKGTQRGPVYSDSDVYKWTEAAGFALQSGDRPQIRSMAEKFIDDVVAAQESSGYLNTYYVDDHASQRMLPQTQTTGHELYNMGHMLQGAIAYYRATGDRKMLDAGIRFVNEFLIPNYGQEPKKPIVSGHPEIELALIELYRITGDKLQLDLAGYILRGDERIKLPTGRTIYMFSGTPFASRTKLEGHAVRAMYACCGATDYYMETGDVSYWKTLNTLWDDMTRTKMYVTGGVGSREAGEAFGDAYELPNYRAYGESCAAIGNMMWNWRMLAATGDAKFTDVIERALASLPGYFYSTSNDGIYLHLYDSSDLDWHLEDGTGLRVTQETNYPWDGSVKIGIAPAKTAEFTFHLRIPGWAEHAQVAVNGKTVTGAKPGEYLPIQRRWAPGDVIHAQFEMTPQVLEANPHVVDDTGRVAVQRGPLIYCLEQLDQPDGVALSDVAVDLGHKSPALFESEFRGDLLGGIVVLRHTGAAYEKTNSRDGLYFRYDGAPLKSRRVPLTFIPYYAWANRAAAAMQVWTPLLKA